jgi:hypothetical protein
MFNIDMLTDYKFFKTDNLINMLENENEFKERIEEVILLIKLILGE